MEEMTGSVQFSLDTVHNPIAVPYHTVIDAIKPRDSGLALLLPTWHWTDLTFMTFIGIVLWFILLVLCWPLALIMLLLLPFIWLLLLPLKIVGFTLELLFKLITAVIMFPFKVLKAI